MHARGADRINERVTLPGRVTRLQPRRASHPATPVSQSLISPSLSLSELSVSLGSPGNGESARLGRLAEGATRRWRRGSYRGWQSVWRGWQRERSFLEQTNRCSLPVLPCNEFNVSPGPAVAPAVVAVAVGRRPTLTLDHPLADPLLPFPPSVSRSLPYRRAFRLPFGRGSTTFCFPTFRRPAGKKLMRLCLCCLRGIIARWNVVLDEGWAIFG